MASFGWYTHFRNINKSKESALCLPFSLTPETLTFRKDSGLVGSFVPHQYQEQASYQRELANEFETHEEHATMNARRLKTWVRGLLLASLVAIGLAVPARAGLINIDPTGGGGANSSDVLATSSFAWAPGNSLAVGGGDLYVGKDVTLYYQAILQGINTSGANTASLGSNDGNISINGVSTGVQFVVTGSFVEQVTALNTVVLPGFNQTVASFALVNSAPSSFNIYAQSSATGANLNSNNLVNEYPTNSLTNPILSGTVSTLSSSTFAVNNLDGTAALLNQHAGGTPGDYAGITTVTGSGNTALTVNVTSYNQNYFLTPYLQELVFNTISSGTPFYAVDPAVQMYNGTVPNVGAINGASGPDILFQSQANNSFVVTPEPATITTALAAFGISGVVAYRRRKVSPSA